MYSIKFIASFLLIFVISETTFCQIFNQIDIASGGNRGRVRIGDMNGDGFPDLVVSDETNNDIDWYKNDGNANPNFSTHEVTDNAGDVATMRIIDLNGDGNLDVLASSDDHNNIIWYKNSGGLNPTFQRLHVVTPFNFAWGVDSGDLDGDNIVDVVGASRDWGDLKWWKNSGGTSPTWTEKDIDLDVPGIFNVAVGDFDGDNDLDVAVTTISSDHVYWYENNGASDPSFTQHTIDNGTANSANDLLATDIDGDGDIDLFAAINPNSIAFYENDGNNPPNFSKTSISVGGATSVVVADVDGDTDKDLLVTGTNSNLTILLNDGNQPANFSTLSQSLSISSNRLDAADLDGDGDIDVGIASWSNKRASWLEQQEPTEIFLSGNANNIANGSNTGSTTNDTNFGDFLCGTSHTHTFTIKNIGEADLSLTDAPNPVSITGTTDFTISMQPVSSTLGENEMTTFQVTFSPSETNPASATISIANNDSDENPFEFVVAGNAFCPVVTIETVINNDIAEEQSSDKLVYKITRSNAPINNTLEVFFEVDASSTASSSDYTITTNDDVIQNGNNWKVIFPMNIDEINVEIVPIPDGIIESDETVVLKLILTP